MVKSKNKDYSKEDQLKELKDKRLSYEPELVVLPSNIKQVESENEYWRVHAIYKKRLNKLTLNFKEMINNPDKYLNEFNLIMGEMLAYGIVDIEWVNQKRKKLYDNLNYPSKYRNWVIKKLSILKRKNK